MGSNSKQKTSRPSEPTRIRVERRGLDVEYYLEGIVEEMLKNRTTHFLDQRNYTVTLNGVRETVTARIEIDLKASDKLLEKAGMMGEE